MDTLEIISRLRVADVSAAVLEGMHVALALDRKSLPALVMHSRELAAELSQRFANDPRVAEYLDQLREVADQG